MFQEQLASIQQHNRVQANSQSPNRVQMLNQLGLNTQRVTRNEISIDETPMSQRQLQHNLSMATTSLTATNNVAILKQEIMNLRR